MDVCVVFVVRTVAWNVKWHEGRKDLNSTKMDQKGKNPGQTKKNPNGGMDVCLLWMLCVVQVETPATGRSLIQRSPSECMYVSLSVMTCNNNPLHLQWSMWKSSTKKFYKNEFINSPVLRADTKTRTEFRWEPVKEDPIGARKTANCLFYHTNDGAWSMSFLEGFTALSCPWGTNP
jgi:hypothetical protein